MEDEEGLFADNLENELLQESDNENNEGTDEPNDVNTANDTNAASSTVIAVKKRIVNRKPQVKLDPDRLCGPRGIPILPDVFDNVKFKGKKHEKEDLDLLMMKLEHWAHRLFPKLPFDQVIDKIEKLGSKKPVQVCVKKMRLDLPILNSDFISHESDDERDIDRNDSNVVTDPFDDLLRAQSNSRNLITSNISNDSSFNTSTSLLNTSNSTVLSDEVRERIERNKQLAAERRKKAQERNSLFENQSQNVSENVEDIAKASETTKALSELEETVEDISDISENVKNTLDDFDMDSIDEDEFLAD